MGFWSFFTTGLSLSDEIRLDYFTIPYSYKFSRVLIFAHIRAERQNARNLIRKFMRSKGVRKNKSERKFWKLVS